MTVSSLWETISRQGKSEDSVKPALRFDAYILTLDLLFLIGAIDLRNGILIRSNT
jgi:hypothetical protein